VKNNALIVKVKEPNAKVNVMSVAEREALHPKKCAIHVWVRVVIPLPVICVMARATLAKHSLCCTNPIFCLSSPTSNCICCTAYAVLCFILNQNYVLKQTFVCTKTHDSFSSKQMEDVLLLVYDIPKCLHGLILDYLHPLVDLADGDERTFYHSLSRWVR
jgi:hypothetical protein